MKIIHAIPPFWKLIHAIVLCELVGIVSGLLSQVEMNVWFETLNKPSWNPPSFIFGPVWGLLYLLMGISIWLIEKNNTIDSDKKTAYTLFALQLFFNFWWSILFFRIHSPFLALVDIIFMIITIAFTIIRFAPISKVAAWLLVPYFLWVSFATFLNYTIWTMN